MENFKNTQGSQTPDENTIPMFAPLGDVPSEPSDDCSDFLSFHNPSFWEI